MAPDLGVAPRHQLAHPEAWAPELIDATASWTVVVNAITQDLQEAVALLQGQPVRRRFADRCETEPELRCQLEHLCTQQLHGLLMKWLVASVQERMAAHAVPQFWEHYCKLAGGHYPLVGVAQQRQCLASAITAVARLHAYMSAQLCLVRLLDLKGWRLCGSSSNAAERGSGATSACSCSSGGDGDSGSGGGSPMVGDEPTDEAGGPGDSPAAAELLTVLGALLQRAAPDTQAFTTWMANCWERAFLDTMRAERSAAWAWQEGDAEAGAEAESMQVVEDEGVDAPAVPALRLQMRQFCAQLRALRWLPLVEPALSATLHAQLRQTLTARCARSFEVRHLSELLGWLGSVAMPWLRLVLQPETEAEGAPDSAALEHWHARLRFAMMQSLAFLRIRELFDLVVDWPDSLAALDDLTECLRHTREHSRLVVQLRAQVSQRLLKPGADTSNIIQVYVCTIRALRHIDPSGVLLEAISEPMRAYLKARSDTVRQIVTSLTDPESSDLLESTGGGTDAEFLQEDHGVEDDSLDLDEIKGDEKAMLQWKPDPVAADPTRSSFSRRSSDVLSCLVNIYGSKALFVNEFRAMLADKLLSAAHQSGGLLHDTEREVRHLELLKKRFGEAALQHCEVMLKDVAESRRVTAGIHKHFGDTEIQVVDATIVSRTCWPPLPAEVFHLPAPVKQQLDRYEKQFLHAKAPRKLAWKPALGCVTLDVHFDDGSVVHGVTCTPMHATILHHFGERRRWTLRELAVVLGVSRDVLKRKLALWLNRGFIHEVDSVEGDAAYEVVTSLGSGDAPRHVTEEEEDSDGAEAKAKQLEDEMKVYEQYVVGMLTNLESLPLDRIHNMLKMFVQPDDGHGGYDRTEQELQRFLGRMVEDGKLESAGGQYKIRAAA